MVSMAAQVGAASSERKQAGAEYIARLKRRTADRDKTISHQARIAQLAAIRESGLGRPHDLSQITQPTFVANGDNDVMVASSQSRVLVRSERCFRCW